MSLVTVLRSPCRTTDNSPTDEQPQPADETDGSGEQGEEEEIRHKTQRSISECYFAVKGTALVLPHDESMHVYRCSNNNVVAGDIRAHLQSMLYMLRREDTLKMAVKLESAHPAGRTRYLVVVSRTNSVGAEEACLLGIDCNHQTTIGLVIPVWADARITLDGDGGFSVTSSHGHYIFKPVSVQAMWSALQSLHKACAKAREFNYFQGGGTHQWVQYYAERIESDQSCLNEWHAMDDLVSKRPPTPDSDRSRPTQKEETEALIRSKLKELMMSVDLDEVTSKFMRSRLEEELDMSLQQFKPFIDQEMLTILGQMDAATEILEYLYLGSEWNASNLEELKDKGVGHILNVTREIDNFYPGFFDYFNIRVYDDETTEMLKHWDKTYKYIAQAKEQGSKVLVHCKMGISRSASVVIAYVMKAYGWDLRQALDFVKTRRSCIKPNSGFMKQLETYQGILHASKQRHNSIWRSKSETNLKDEQPDRSGGRRECRATTSQTLNMGSAAGGCGSITDGAGPLRASGNSSRGSSLLVPGSVSRPKSWSPDDLASDAFFAANNSNNNNSDGMPSPMHAAIAPGRSKASRRRTGRPRYGTDPLCYTIPPMNAMNAASTTLQQVHATEQEKNAKNTAANGVKANLTVAAPVVPPKCPPAVVTIADEDPGLRRVASVKDRICELESQVGAPKPGGAKPVIKAEVLRSSTTEAVPATARLSKLPLVFLGGPTKTGAAEESPVNVYSCLPSCGGGELSSLELLRDVQPVASQTKPLTPKHTAVIVKSSPPAWTLGGGDSDRELELPTAAPVVEAVPPTTPKEATFSSVLRRSVEDRLPTSPGGVALQRSATDVGLLVAPTSQVACRPAGRHHTLPLHCDAEDTTTTCTARPLAEICKLQVGFGQDSRSESSTATSEARKDATTVVTPQSPLVAELQVDGKKTERFEEHTSMPVDRTGSLLTRCKLRKAKPCLEEKSFARALCLEGGSFPAQTRSMPSTPPEQLPDAPSSPSRQILRSQSLRCEHRPRSLALPATTVPPCMSGRSPPKILDTHAGEAQPLPAFAPGPEIRHSMSTPSVMEAVNEVLCETRQVISNAMHFIPCHSPEAYLPTRGSSQGQERIDPEVTPMPEASEVPQAGIVRQQRAVLEGLQPLRGGTTSMTPANADRKPPVGDSLGRSKKEQTRIIKELGSTMLPPSASPPTGDSPPLGTADQHPEDDESAVGVVKRLTKELEAKARNGKTKPPGIAERLVIVERSAIDGSHESPNCGGSSSTPNSPVCERHCCGQSLRGVRAFSEGRPDLPLVPTTTPAPPTPSRCASFDADRLRRLSATRSITALLARAPRVGEPPPPQLPSLVTGTPTVALIATMPAPAPVGTNPTLPGGLQRKVRKQQGKTHPLSKLTVRQRHANPLYNTM